MLPLLDARQLIELCQYHAIVGKPGIDHADVPLAVQASAVLSYLSESDVRPELLMPHLEPPEQTPEEMLNILQASLHK